MYTIIIILWLFYFQNTVVRIFLGWDQGPPELFYFTLCMSSQRSEAYVNKFGMLQNGKKDN